MKRLLCTVALVGMLVAPGVVQAQMSAGAFGAYGTDDPATFGIGGFVAIPLTQLGPGFAIVPDFTYFFPDVGSIWELNGDLMYSFPVAADAPIAPFAFAGLNYVHFSVDVLGTSFSSSDTGLNVGGGANFPMGSLTPFAGAKLELGGGENLILFGGIGFPIGGGA